MLSCLLWALPAGSAFSRLLGAIGRLREVAGLQILDASRPALAMLFGRLLDSRPECSSTTVVRSPRGEELDAHRAHVAGSAPPCSQHQL